MINKFENLWNTLTTHSRSPPSKTNPQNRPSSLLSEGVRDSDHTKWCLATKQVVILKLTVPWNVWVEEVSEPGMQTWCRTAAGQGGNLAWSRQIEVGCKGCAGHNRRPEKTSSLARHQGSREGLEMAVWLRRSDLDLISPGWVTWVRVYVVLRPETPYNPEQHHWWCVWVHHKMYLINKESVYLMASVHCCAFGGDFYITAGGSIIFPYTIVTHRP